MLSKILYRLNNKYVYTFLVFLAWIIFFDKNNLISRYKTIKTLQDAQQQKEFYQSQISNDQKIIDGLQNDSAALERFAREKYLMKRDNEDLFLVVDGEK
ncbi:MAG: septum formation initiator family protein [Bacteroidetes bacterium]|nr:septum formation initiator family protein [Bacteroidota bacterium]